MTAHQATAHQAAAHQATADQTNSASPDVGFGKPPRHTQFRKGQSGNPGGRPRREPIERVKALALQEAYRMVSVKKDGRVVRMSAIQAVLRSQFESAASGNARAQSVVLEMVRDLELDRALDAQAGRPVPPVIVDDADDFDDGDHDASEAADDGGRQASRSDETSAGIGRPQEDELRKSAAPPSSADSAVRPGSGGLPTKSSKAASPTLKPPAAGGRVSNQAATGDTASARGTASKREALSKRQARRERGRARTPARKATVASPELEIGGPAHAALHPRREKN